MEPTTTSSYQTTPQTQPSLWSVGVKGGLYTGLVLIIFTLISYVAGLNTDPWFGNLFQLFSFVIGIYLTHKAFKEQGDGFMSYGQGLGLGAIVGLISSVLTAIFAIIYVNLIDDTIISSQLDEMRFQFEEQGLSDEQIDQAISMTEMMMGPIGMFFSIVFMSVLYAFILSLIVSAFTKRTDPTVEY